MDTLKNILIVILVLILIVALVFGIIKIVEFFQMVNAGIISVTDALNPKNWFSISSVVDFRGILNVFK